MQCMAERHTRFDTKIYVRIICFQRFHGIMETEKRANEPHEYKTILRDKMKLPIKLIMMICEDAGEEFFIIVSRDKRTL